MLKQKIEIKPLSVNDCWQGRRFKTPKYKAYEQELLWQLKTASLPPEPYCVRVFVGFKTAASDLDNVIKPLLDILQKKYGFNDNKIVELNLKKTKSKTPFIDFEITQAVPDN